MKRPRFPSFAASFLMLGVAACGAYASDPEPGVAPRAAAAADEPPTTDETPPQESPPAPSESAAVEVVLTGRPFEAFAIGDTHMFTLEADVRTRLVAIEKAAPHAVKVLIEEDILDNVKFEGLGFARGRVFVTDSYGVVKSAKADGTDVQHEYVPGLPTRLFAAPQTLWLADLPRFLGEKLVFRWHGATPAEVPSGSAQIVPPGAVGDLAVDDEALVYATYGSTTTLRHWAPATTGTRGGHRLLATLPEQGRGLGIDATRAYVALVGAKEVRAYDRATGASSTILASASFDTPPQLRSDGKNLFLLTETALRRCSLAACSTTMTVLASDLTAARALFVDASHAWIVMTPKGKTGAIVRVPK